MFRRSLTWILARSVTEDTHRLLRGFRFDALFVARHAVLAAREYDRKSHWTRVLTEVEIRSGYRPW